MTSKGIAVKTSR